jgi:hypothetical protein
VERLVLRVLPEPLPVDAEGDAIALPGHVVARRIVPHVDARLVLPRRRGRLDGERARRPRREARLEEQLVERPVAVVVDDLRDELLPLGVDHAHAVGGGGGELPPHLRPRQRDRLVRPGERERVLGTHGEARRRLRGS